MESHHKNIKKLRLMLVLTATFCLIEMTVGYSTRSMTLVSDSFHMLSDVVALLVAYICIRVSMKKWSKSTFGLARAEVLGSLINAVFLCALCFSIFIEAIKRFNEPEGIKRPKLVLCVGFVGLFINLIGLLLFIDSHSVNKKTTDLNKQNVEEFGKTEDDEENSSEMNIRGVFIHILADAIGSFIVIISAAVEMYIDWEYKIYVDPSLSLLSVLIILASTWSLMSSSSLILLQTLPPHIDVDNLKKELITKVPGILEIHELHIWQLTSEKHIATIHILCRNQEYMSLASQIKRIFHGHKVHSTTIQPEFVDSPSSVKGDLCLVECPPTCSTCCHDPK